ncbi:hypothetical protein U9M48_001082 [Paspalum notatum var. saurae]|uniref:DUF4220 domain-containing protein n=1 Tax=Paspalum notatum var. saurae TaxID=547442 RepID=A0AAQ3PLC4_PASNO
MDPRSSPASGVSSNAAAALQEEIYCTSAAVEAFYGTMGRQIWLGNALLLSSAVMTGVMVGIDSYRRRYQHHHFTRFIYLGANTLFLPIISYVVSTLRDSSNDYVNRQVEDGGAMILAALCSSTFHPCMVITWALLVQMAALSTCSVVATDSRREDGKEGPPWELLVRGVWILYLGASITNGRFFHGLFLFRFSPSKENQSVLIALICSKIMFAPFALLFAKIWLKWYSFHKARKSSALGRNPSLVFGYMQQLQQEASSGGMVMTDDEDAPTCPPPLLVMGEDRRQVEMKPWGYVFIRSSSDDNNPAAGWVTLDRIWKLDNNMLPTTALALASASASAAPRLKDLCLSFALFKLLRGRLARYGVVADANTARFFWRSLLLLKDDAGEHDNSRVFRVVSDELSFIHDYYYSSIPVSYAKWWLPLLNIFVSLLSIGYCIVAAYFTLVLADRAHKRGRGQIHCSFWCSKPHALVGEPLYKEFGNSYMDVLPEFVLIAVVLVAEVRDVFSYICSNWTKVALVCHWACALQQPHRHSSSSIHRLAVCLLLKCKCRILNQHWDAGKTGQCSVLVLRPSTGITTALVGGLRRLFHLPDVKGKVKMPAAVKACILKALRSDASSSGRQCLLGNGTASLQWSQAGRSFLWVWSCCNGGSSTSEIILTWHIATCILEFRHSAAHRHDTTEQAFSPTPNQHNKFAATHLSRYCAYLMSWSPELLPDEEAWSRSLYEAVKEDAERVMAGRHPSMPPERSNHQVLKNGVRLGKQLVELVEGEDMAWAVLAGFWAEMILYIAPSSNLEEHKRAIARGGELITLL